MTGQQLKNSILQMAVQGKLVPQDPNDEPASVLVERIRAEKGKLIKEKKIKKEKNPSYIFRGADNLPYEQIGKNDPVCIADEVPFEIPDTWEWIRVKFATTLFNGKAFKPSDWSESGQPIVRIQNLNDLSAPFNYYSGDVDAAFQLLGGELLFAWSGTPGTSFGAHIWDRGKAVLNQHIFKLEFDEKSIYKEYYKHALNQRVGMLILAAHGSAGLQHVTKGVFENTLIPLPPYEEQVRIVKKLNTLFPIVEQYGEKYRNVEQINATFPDNLKKSILQWAVQGKLVPQDPNDEPASVLLERIREEKAQLVKEGKTKKDKNESVIFRRDNSHYEKHGKTTVCIDEQLPHSIPENWQWCHISEMCFFQEGPGILAKDFMPDGIPLIRIAGMQGESVRLTGCNYLDPQMVKEKWNHFKLDLGDIVISTSASMDKIAEVTEEAVGAIPYTGLIRFKMHGGILKEYFKYFIKSPCYINQIAEQEAGAAIKHYGPTHLRKMFIPIPPINEQQRIVNEINAIMPHINAL